MNLTFVFQIDVLFFKNIEEFPPLVMIASVFSFCVYQMCVGVSLLPNPNRVVMTRTRSS